MSTKTFMLLLFGVLVFGGGLGGSFVAGLVVGNGQEAEAALSVVLPLPASSSVAAQLPNIPGSDDLDFANLRQRAQSGELSEDERTTLREQFSSRFGGVDGAGQFTGQGGFGGRGASLTGRVIDVVDNVLMLDTAQGVLQVSIGDDVAIRQIIEGAIEDLSEGTRITVIGQRDDERGVIADTVQIIPEGVDFTEGGGFGGGGGFRGFGVGGR